MGLICNILESKISRRSGTSNPAQWLIDWVSGGTESSSGVRVTESSALKYTPFWAAVRIISGTLASLPFIVYKREGKKGKDRAPDHRVYKLLHDRPNEYMDALTFQETRQAHVLTYGNGYAEIQRDGGGRPVALWPLLPDRTARKISDGGILYYEVRTQTGETFNLPDYNVLHIKGLGFDGYTGYNVVAYHKEAIGYGVAVKEYGSRFFSQGANAGGVYEHPNSLSPKARKNLEESLQLSHTGLSKAHRLMILEEGMKWNKTGIEPAQAQALEVQKYTVDDCARIFNIPPHKIASLDRATFSNIEEQNIDFVTTTMLYWFRKWELECNYKLFMPSEYKKMFCEILVSGLLRGNMAARTAFYSNGRQWGYLNVNDIHEFENMNPIGPAGDVYLEPTNMRPAGTYKPEPDKAKRDDIRQAHRDLIASQLLRIGRKKFTTNESLRNFANTILFEPVNAYASLFNRQNESRDILNKIIENRIVREKVQNNEDIEILADNILQEIGGNHYAL
jgi:HK97 family phage portal protein